MSGWLLSDPLVWAARLQVPVMAVRGRAWQLLLHPDDRLLLIESFVSLINPETGLVPLPSLSQSCCWVLRLRVGQSYDRYEVQVIPVQLIDQTYHWVFVATSLTPTPAAYAERNLQAVMTVAISLDRTALQSLVVLHNRTLRPPLCRRLAVLTDQAAFYLDHVEQGVRYFTALRSRS